MRRLLALAAVLVLAACGGDGVKRADPYERYLELLPAGEEPISRDDASTRATLGCGTDWPPGTTDAILAEAYAGWIDC